MTATTTSAATPGDGVRPEGTDGGRPRGRRTPRGSGRLRGRALPYLLLLPAVLMELLIHLVPMVYGVMMSFKQLTQFFIRNWTGAPWNGLDNYKVSFDFNGAVGAGLLDSFVTTVCYTVLVVGLSWLLGTAASILMQGSFRGRAVLRTVFLVPYALPVYAATITFAFIFQHDNGMLNHLLHDELHLTDKPSFWLIDSNSFWAMVIVSVWRNWPFAFLVLMAGLQNVPGELYEASAIDGAGVWKQIRHITLPSLRAVNQVLLLVLFLWNFNDFNTPFVLFGKAPPEAADLVSIHIYRNSFVNWNFGTGSAMSVLLLLFLLVVTALYLWFTSRERKTADV
ncbi:carbohydrate ABC transporter permease [Streptomyces sp. NPDC059740]|uniref:carbohydrate ABC transporter permease n=1 Tax=Streptomyces sp. NPDC059740 TaxID=3346926 RepID=UPI0036682E44